MKPVDRARMFLARALEDEVIFEEVVGSARVSDASMGFHAQQAAEKLLKAVLVARGVAYRRTHDLRELIDLALDNGVPFPSEFMAILAFAPFAVDLRYEGPVSEPEPPFDRGGALALVKRVRAWAEGEVRAADRQIPTGHRPAPGQAQAGKTI